jgi:hypothetical protein
MEKITTKFSDYSELPFSQKIQQELMKRHTHGELTEPEEIVYKEFDVLTLLLMMKYKWISVKVRLPEYQGWGKPQTVIVSGIDDEKRYVFYAECHAYGEKKTAEEIFTIPGWSQMNVTHWMPFPEPPKE